MNAQRESLRNLAYNLRTQVDVNQLKRRRNNNDTSNGSKNFI